MFRQKCKRNLTVIYFFNKEKARGNKNADKGLALRYDDLVVACFDLEEVLLIHHTVMNLVFTTRGVFTHLFLQFMNMDPSKVIVIFGMKL
jgi:hypothetical protein